MYECPKDCLSRANSFSEPSATNTEKDVLHCMVHNEKVVDNNSCVNSLLEFFSYIF